MPYGSPPDPPGYWPARPAARPSVRPALCCLPGGGGGSLRGVPFGGCRSGGLYRSPPGHEPGLNHPGPAPGPGPAGGRIGSGRGRVGGWVGSGAGQPKNAVSSAATVSGCSSTM